MTARIKPATKIARLPGMAISVSLITPAARNFAPDAADEAAARMNYRDQLTRLTRAIASQDCTNVAAILAADSTPELVQYFLEGNLEKRCDSLRDHLSFVGQAFDDFEPLIDRYVLTAPLAAYDTAVADADRMLKWLAGLGTLTRQQLDYVLCQRARHVVEELAQARRLEYVRFQERRSLLDRWLPDFEPESCLRLYLNPIRAWAKFETSALLDAATAAPADVLFFPRDGEISSAVLELEGQALLNELADFQPCTVSEWAAVSHVHDVHHLRELTCDLAKMGLIALG